MEELVQEYIDAECPMMEGKQGIEALKRFLSIIDENYNEDKYDRYNKATTSTLFLFLQDNSGCIEAIYEWVGKQDVQHWKENLSNYMNEAYGEIEE